MKSDACNLFCLPKRPSRRLCRQNALFYSSSTSCMKNPLPAVHRKHPSFHTQRHTIHSQNNCSPYGWTYKWRKLSSRLAATGPRRRFLLGPIGGFRFRLVLLIGPLSERLLQTGAAGRRRLASARSVGPRPPGVTWRDVQPASPPPPPPSAHLVPLILSSRTPVIKDDCLSPSG